MRFYFYRKLKILLVFRLTVTAEVISRVSPLYFGHMLKEFSPAVKKNALNITFLLSLVYRVWAVLFSASVTCWTVGFFTSDSYC